MKKNQSAAGAAGVLGLAATDDSSASEAPDADPITDTANEAATSTQSVSASANDNEPVLDEPPGPGKPELELAPANDNNPVEGLPATGTEN